MNRPHAPDCARQIHGMAECTCALQRKSYGAAVRIWDKGPGAVFRYTLLPPRSGRAWARYRDHWGGWDGVGVSPTGLHVRMQAVHPGAKLGQRIAWQELPAAAQLAAKASFLAEYCRPFRPMASCHPEPNTENRE